MKFKNSQKLNHSNTSYISISLNKAEFFWWTDTYLYLNLQIFLKIFFLGHQSIGFFTLRIKDMILIGIWLRIVWECLNDVDQFTKTWSIIWVVIPALYKLVRQTFWTIWGYVQMMSQNAYIMYHIWHCFSVIW